MSLKQLRKLRELRAGGVDGSEAERSEDGSPRHSERARSSAFALLAESSEESSQEAEGAGRESPASDVANAEDAEDADALQPGAADDDEAVLAAAMELAAAEQGEANQESGPSAPTVSLRREAFSVEAERRRAAGARVVDQSRRRGRAAVQARGHVEGHTAHHRRLFLVKPTADEHWHRPDDFARMSSEWDEENAEPVFRLRDTPASLRSLEALRTVLRSQDPEELRGFLEHHPFCVDGLLTMAAYLVGRAEHEQAFQLTRRAVYVVECGFHPSFSAFTATGSGWTPDRPRCRLRLSQGSEDWPGWSWYRALVMYGRGLAGQGLHRTSLEVSKLLLATSLPRDPAHALHFCDYLALRARAYDALGELAGGLVVQYMGPTGEEAAAYGLCQALPNFAFSMPLAGLLKPKKPLALALLGEVAIDMILPRATTENAVPVEAAVPAALMQALLLFPLVLRPLLEEGGVNLQSAPGGSGTSATWLELLSQRPFVDAADFLHETHAVALGNACAHYAKQCGSLWRADLPLRWLHACAARLASLHGSSVFAADLTKAREEWRAAKFPFEDAFLLDYVDLRPTEAHGEDASMPTLLDRAVQARLHPPQGGLGGYGGGHGQMDLQPTVSLHSPTLLVFWQTLLPWNEVDRSGVLVQPLTWGAVAGNATGAIWSQGRGALRGICEVVVWLLALGKEVAQELRHWWRSD